MMSSIIKSRRSPRIHTRLPVLLLWEEGQQGHREYTFTLRVSWFGCLVSSHNYFHPGTRARLQHDGKTMHARVIYSLMDHSTNLVEVGLEFDRDGRQFWGAVIWAE